MTAFGIFGNPLSLFAGDQFLITLATEFMLASQLPMGWANREGRRNRDVRQAKIA
jgi:hypothetical protein